VLPDGNAVIALTFQVAGTEELETVRSRIRSLSGVTEIRRGRA